MYIYRTDHSFIVRCCDCGRKLNIFSDYKQVEFITHGDKATICTRCYNKIEKAEVKRLLLTEEGREEVKDKGARIAIMGLVYLFIGAVILMLTNGIMQIFTVICFGLGFFNVLRGIHYKRISRSNA